MKILVTGSGGFLGKNLIANIAAQSAEHVIYTYDKSNDLEDLKAYTKECDFVYHFAAVHRPTREEEFLKVNYEFFHTLLALLRENGNKCPVLYTSSIQAVQNTEYAKSKRMAEEALREHERLNDSKVFIYRLTNTFGKWAKPCAYSVVATFCYNIARERDIELHNPDTFMRFYYVDDVTDSFLRHLEEEILPDADGYYRLTDEYCYTVTLKELADTIRNFKKARENNYIPDMKTPFTKKLYSTYLSYLPLEELRIPLLSHRDDRGSFTEILKTEDRGQISLNITKPGIKKGEHYHNTKCEKFLVISGTALLQLRRVGSKEITEYFLSGDELCILEVPPGFTHNLINMGESDLYTLIWANEVFDPAHPDTYHCPVSL
ncbi:polysaccharide biosynthesis C-terminal domain-containing protein [Anaerocolumna xylanovorans]|uniref:UDP-2-acetamido-2,6-beta-L-arabino-hexul-4-ose reductase n=1 Tax=Anaerocolumna xylanovorans DSM 12503 TaxID=1121345 RepID=A0A1M7Y1I7_9FIRM|nr:NAD-dependent epimerase/dehydratase family protein [Anaerocolumna xylanovorans]SHO45683.1 UDP-2-acetamido-2,6-beta-L-arabino-hexul-4-ose reductase [Anaerocolumna xylanovorans DSM 12503]